MKCVPGASVAGAFSNLASAIARITGCGWPLDYVSLRENRIVNHIFFGPQMLEVALPGTLLIPAPLGVGLFSANLTH